MSDQTPNSEARERVLSTAEKLFAERGYKAVRLRDVADALGIKQASLYYHVPHGKEALYVEVTERNLRRHQLGLKTLIGAASSLRTKLSAAANWLLSQPPMDLGRMLQSDMVAITPEEASRLELIAYDALLMPIADIFIRAGVVGEIRQENPIMLAGALISVIESLCALPEHYLTQSRHVMAESLITLFLDGLRVR